MCALLFNVLWAKALTDLLQIRVFKLTTVATPIFDHGHLDYLTHRQCDIICHFKFNIFTIGDILFQEIQTI